MTSPCPGRPHAARRFLALAALLLAAFFLAPAVCLARGWSVETGDGARWLVTPRGERFFSLGVNTTNGGSRFDLEKGDHAYHFTRFYPDLAAWGAKAQERLTAWGFNTAGGWSEPSAVMSLPLIPEIDLGRNAKLHWYDIFAPSMQDDADAMAREIMGWTRNNPRVLGVFTDNEVGWWNAPLFSWHLERPWAIHSKRVLWRMLFERYEGKWEKLLEDFVPASEGLDSFEKLKEGGAALKLRPGGRGIRAVGQFTRRIAGRYYELVFRAMRKAAPELLVVGDRLPLYYDQNAVLAQRGFVDVLSSNYNVDCEDGWVAPYYFEGLRELSPAPVLISEFFFAADENRSGNTNNGHLMHVATQEQRARGAAAAVRNFASFPNVAGVHWFQYNDEPTGGRGDGEDFNMGLVDIHDKPYELLTQALAQANAQAPALHAASRWTQAPAEGVAPVLLRAAPGHSATDGSLLDWKDKAGTRLLGFKAPKPYAPFGDVHVVWSPEGLAFFTIAGNYVDLSLMDAENFPLSETFQLRFTVDAGAGPRAFGVHMAPRPHSVWPGRYELVPQLWRYENGKPAERVEAPDLVKALDKPLPHIQVEGFLPAGLLGVQSLRPGQEIRLGVEAENFYRELTMAWAGRTVVLGQALDNAGEKQ